MHFLKFLELRIPPPLMAVACAVLAWVLGAVSPPDWRLDFAGRLPLAGLCLLLGVGLDGWSLWNFHRHRTTVKPWMPGRTRALVVAGPYRFTRNPMYLGLVLMLLALCLWRGQPLALWAVVLLVASLTRFQILPEERALSAKFGAAYEAYRRRVRRWL